MRHIQDSFSSCIPLSCFIPFFFLSFKLIFVYQHLHQQFISSGRRCGKGRDLGRLRMLLVLCRQIGKYLAFLRRPSISTRSGKIHLSKQFKQKPLIRYLSQHCLTSQFVIFPLRTSQNSAEQPEGKQE